MLDDHEDAAASEIIEQARRKSSDNVTFTSELIKVLNDHNSQNAALLLNHYVHVQAASILLSYADVPNKIVEG